MQEIRKYAINKFKKRNNCPSRYDNGSQNNQPLKKQIQNSTRSEKLPHYYNLSQIYTNEVRRKKGKKRFFQRNHAKIVGFILKNDHLYKIHIFY